MAPLSNVSIFVTGTNSSDFGLQTNNCSSALAVNASCQIKVKFTPSAPGPRTGSITLKSNADNSHQTVSLSGTGIETPPRDVPIAGQRKLR